MLPLIISMVTCILVMMYCLAARRKALLCDNGELCPLSAWLLLQIIVSMVALILVMMLCLDCPVQSISNMEGHCVSA